VAIDITVLIDRLKRGKKTPNHLEVIKSLKALDESSTLLSQKRGEFNEAFQKYAAKELEEAEKIKNYAHADSEEVLPTCHSPGFSNGEDPEHHKANACNIIYNEKEQRNIKRQQKKQQADKNLKIKQAVKKAADLDDENAVMIAKNDLLSTIDSKSSSYVDLNQESKDLKLSIERYLEATEQKNTDAKNAQSAQKALDKQNELFYGEWRTIKPDDHDSIFFQKSYEKAESETVIVGSPSIMEESYYTN
jgi:hypothetical protein